MYRELSPAWTYLPSPTPSHPSQSPTKLCPVPYSSFPLAINTYFTHSGDIYGIKGGSDNKESACNAGYLGLIPGLGRSPGEGNGNALQYPGLENSTDCTVHGVAKSQDTTK